MQKSKITKESISKNPERKKETKKIIRNPISSRTKRANRRLEEKYKNTEQTSNHKQIIIKKIEKGL